MDYAKILRNNKMGQLFAVLIDDWKLLRNKRRTPTSVGVTMSASSAGVKMSPSSAGVKMSASSAGVKMSPSSACVTMSPNSAGVNLSQSTGGFNLSQSSGGLKMSPLIFLDAQSILIIGTKVYFLIVHFQVKL